MMGGTIGFESVEGVGSCFWFTVPLKRAAAQPAQPPDHNVLAGRRVLVVDDVALNRDILQRLIENWGAAAVTAEGAAQALARLREATQCASPFDIILLDHHMPEMSGTDLAVRLRADPALKGVQLLLLTSGDPGALAAARASGRFDAVLAKPLRHDALLAGLLGRQRPGMVAVPPAGNAAAAAGPATLPLRVLLAEDNGVNQQVAVALLSKLGHRTDVANDGGEAVTMIERGNYDLVLMDMQMPNVDGLQATHMIRALRGPKGRVPIIAMTANALAGDREICLAAGMNDYIAKPVDRRRLAALLAKWSAIIAPPPTEAGPSGAVAVDATVQEELVDALGSDRTTALMAQFFADTERLLADAEAACVDRDLRRVAATAHSIKGSAANVGFPRVALMASRAEQTARTGSGDITTAVALLRSAVGEVHRRARAETPGQ